VSAENDATLNELRCRLEQQIGVLIGRSTLDRMLRKLNLKLKKKHSTLLKKKGNRSGGAGRDEGIRLIIC